jgi:hypothetical protein
MTRPAERDDFGYEVKPGDWISFTYGIPPTRVDAQISGEKGALLGTCMGHHQPKHFRLRDLRRYVGSWYKSDGPKGNRHD